MCGISGFIDYSLESSQETLSGIAAAMADSLCHRGPDDSGVWVDASSGVALGHRRLSIIDLSPEGRQPMLSVCARYVMVFNGEVYNFREIKRRIEEHEDGVRWRGHSDTEVMLAAISRWGIDEAVPQFNGMFAFALWDRKERQIHLVRDRLGKKPLYYGWMGDVFLFGSELKALRAHPSFRTEINRDALALYLRHSCIPDPYSIYRSINKLPPGCRLTITPGTHTASSPFSPYPSDALSRTSRSPVRYWSARQVAERGIAEPFEGSETEATEKLDALLRDAVRLRMESDVPLGAFLSGGVDSSLVVALMQAQGERPARTFTIGSWEKAYNEAEDAQAVARHLGTEHTELYISPEDAMGVIPRLSTLYDEPFGDASQIPTFLVSQLARAHVTVSLSGDGGDELFAGYNRYFWGEDIWRRTEWLPRWARSLCASALTGLSPQRWEAVFARLGTILPRGSIPQLPGDKLHKLAEVLAAKHPEEMYFGLVSRWKEPTSVVKGSQEPPTIVTTRQLWARLPEFAHRMMFLDLVSYLPDDILTKVDRASMGVSLEARAPMLDYRVVEFAWRLPLSMKIRNGTGKWLLRQVLYRYVPRELLERPKKGFGIPLGIWLRGPLRDWAEGLLDEDRLRREGYLNAAPIRQKWREHLTGQRNWQYHLWDVLMFQSWLERWGQPRGESACGDG